MTLNYHAEEDDQRQLKVTVDVEEDRVQRAMRAKARELARQLHIPGFRPGKAPYGVVVRRIGAEALRVEAAESLAPDIFEELLSVLDIHTYGQPTLDDMELEPFRLQFTVPLEPVVDLDNYRAIRLEKETVAITDEAVDDALQHVRANHEVIEPVERPAEPGDLLTLSGRGMYVDSEGEEQVLFDEERREMLLDADVTFKGTGFVEKLIGLETGDEAAFEIMFPDEYDDEVLAGREASFNLTVLDVKRRELPALDDELAKLEGSYETLEELRAALAENLKEQAEQQARADFFENMISKIRDGATLNYPPAAVEAELDSALEDMQERIKRVGWEWEDYLRLQKETEESIRESWREAVVDRLERDLILLHFVRNERLTLSQDAIDGAIEERTAEIDDEELRVQMREYYENGPGLQRLSNELVFDMVFERMEAIGAGTAPDPAELEGSEDSQEDESELHDSESATAVTKSAITDTAIAGSVDSAGGQSEPADSEAMESGDEVATVAETEDLEN